MQRYLGKQKEFEYMFKGKLLLEALQRIKGVKYDTDIFVATTA
ncbi:hypothetical protein [Sulfurovum sp.]|nr:hypothetical protein [Sulfurovum sp.]